MDRNSWKLVSNHYQIKSQINKNRGNQVELCAMCGEEICNHDPMLKQPQTVVADILEYFADSFLNMSVDCWFDLERQIINWPDIGEYDHKMEYEQIPALDIPFSFVHKDKIGIIAHTSGENNKKLVEYIENVYVANGTYFGYFTGDKFYLVRAFRDGKWIGLQRFDKLPSVDDVRIEDGLPITGFWYIPQTPDPFEFSRCLVHL